MVKTLLVIECTESYNWYEVFKGATVHGEAIVVEQASWQDVTAVSYPNQVVVSIKKAKNPLPNTTQANDRTVMVDFLFLRSVSRGIQGMDSRNLLLAFIHQGIPSVNSLLSAYLCGERPTTFGALKQIQDRLGKENFPLIEQTYYASFREMLISPDLPCVCKIAHAQSGYGKMRIFTSVDWADFRSVCAIHPDYVTAEPFIEWDWDGRVQKIGSHYRAFKRTSSNWKGNTGNQSIVEEMEVTEQMKMWADECSKVLGGLDILGLDFLHDKKTGKFHILELNDTAIGLVHAVAEQDMKYMRDLVVMRMEEAFKPKNSEVAEEKEESVESLQQKLKAASEEVAQLKLELQREKEQNAELEAKLNAPPPERKKKWIIY